MSSVQLSAGSGMAAPYPGRDRCMSEDRWTYPTRDEDPREIDREMSDGDLAAIKEATRAVTTRRSASARRGPAPTARASTRPTASERTTAVRRPATDLRHLRRLRRRSTG